jgi:hypothetical protein
VTCNILDNGNIRIHTMVTYLYTLSNDIYLSGTIGGDSDISYIGETTCTHTGAVEGDDEEPRKRIQGK